MPVNCVRFAYTNLRIRLGLSCDLAGKKEMHGDRRKKKEIENWDK
jgi:hypothetical protein